MLNAALKADSAMLIMPTIIRNLFNVLGFPFLKYALSQASVTNINGIDHAYA